MRQKLLRSFGASVRKERERQGLSQERLAERSDCHRNYIGLIERGERNPSLTRLVGIARGLGVAPHQLLKGLDLGNGAHTAVTGTPARGGS